MKKQWQHIWIIGDSISDRRTHYVDRWYFDWLDEWWQPKLLTVDGIAGSTIGDEYDSMCGRLVKIPDDVDLILIYGGINDFGRSQPLGQMGDQATTTFYGALHFLLSNLQAMHPKASIVVINHVKIGNHFFPEINGCGLAQVDYGMAIEQLTSALAVPLINLYRSKLSFAIANYREVSLDTLHPNDQGQLMIAEMINHAFETDFQSVQ